MCKKILSGLFGDGAAPQEAAAVVQPTTPVEKPEAVVKSANSEGPLPILTKKKTRGQGEVPGLGL